MSFRRRALPEAPRAVETQTVNDPNVDRRAVLRWLSFGAGSLALGGCRILGDSAPKRPEVSSKPERYALHRGVTATLFWIGEAADADNAYISNWPTAWDENAPLRFGGPDGSTEPNTGFGAVGRDSRGIVTGFRPKHNPYYFALPAGEFNEHGLIPGARERSPWAAEAKGLREDQSLWKGRWMRVTNEKGDAIYAQWLDVGPNEEDDYDYVFGNGTQKPKNTFGLHAGLDLSPAAAKGLGYEDGGIEVSWQFVDAADVPDGPWKEYAAIDNNTYYG